MQQFDISKPLNIIIDKIEGWATATIDMMPNLLVALVILLAAFLIGRLCRRLSHAGLMRTTGSQVISDLGSTIVWVGAISFGVFTALEVVNLEKTVTSLLAGLGIFGIALGFAFQEIATNFMAGILIAIQRPYSVNDVIEVSGFHGTVTKIELRTTRVRTFDGLEVIIPNKDLFTNPLVNFTTTPDRRLSLEVGVSYGDDLEKVQRITRDALSDIRGISSQRPIDIYYREFGSSSINFVVHLWINYPGDQFYFKAPNDAILAIKKAFDANDITIPFPIRTLDFGIKGGQTLAEMLPKGPTT